MWGDGYGFDWLSMILMSLGMVLWIALPVVLVWAIIRWLERKTTTPASPVTNATPSGPSALELLQQRFALGEIDTATFEQMRERLSTLGARDQEPATSSL